MLVPTSVYECVFRIRNSSLDFLSEDDVLCELPSRLFLDELKYSFEYQSESEFVKVA